MNRLELEALLAFCEKVPELPIRAGTLVTLIGALLEEAPCEDRRYRAGYRWEPAGMPLGNDAVCALCDFKLTNIASRTIQELVDHEAACPKDPRNHRPLANWSA